MAITILEVIFKAVVSEDKDTLETKQESIADQEAIVEACVEKVIDILEREKGR